MFNHEEIDQAMTAYDREEVVLMSKSDKWFARVCIDNGSNQIPYLLIDSDGKVTLLVSEEEQKQYEQKMLCNMGESMSRFYSTHPEYLEKYTVNNLSEPPNHKLKYQ